MKFFRSLNPLFKFFLIFALNLYTGILGLKISPVSTFATLFWAPTGISLTAIFLWGYRFWPAVFLSEFLINLQAGASLWAAAGISIGNTAEAVIGVFFLQKVFGFQPSMNRLRDVFALVLAGPLLSNPVSPLVGVLCLWWDGRVTSSAFGTTAWAWWVGDALSNLVVAPFLLVWAVGGAHLSSPWGVKARDTSALKSGFTNPIRFGRIFEGGALISFLLLVCSSVFFGRPFIGVPLHARAYLIFPFLIWAAIRFGQKGATAASLVVSMLALASTLMGVGPFSGVPLLSGLYLLQMFQGVIALTTLILAAVVSERQFTTEELAQAMELLRQSNSRLRLATEFGQVGIWEWNIITNQLTWGRPLEDQLGYREGQSCWTLDDFTQRVHPEDREVLAQARQKAIETKSEFYIDYRVILPDKSVRWLSARARAEYNDSGQPMTMLGANIDITDRKYAETTRRFLEKVALQAGATLDYESTLQRITRLMVPELCDWCVIHIIENEKIQARALAHIEPEQEKSAWEVFQRFPRKLTDAHGAGLVLRTGRSEIYPEVSGDHQGGSAPWVPGGMGGEYPETLRALGALSFMCVPLQAHGQVFGTLLFIFGMKGRRYSAEDLSLGEELARRASLAIDNARLYMAAQKAIALREEFMSIASHEMKTPLTPLKMQLGIVRRLLRQAGGASWPQNIALMKVLENSDQQVDRLVRLIDDLLDVSRITAGHLTLNIEDVNLSDLVHEVLSRFQSEIDRAQCRIELEIQPSILARWDRLRVEQIVINLLTNALKYGSGKPIQIRVLSDGIGAKLIFHDFGIGIKKEDQGRIFERFERAGTIRSFPGLGLGLFITRQIVEAHGGSIRVESEPGAGSKFIVEMPLGVPAEAAGLGVAKSA